MLRRLAVIFFALILSGCAANGSVYAPGHAVAATGRSAQASERVLYSFTGGSDGGNAATALVFDGKGNLYGTTVIGGTAQCGTVFELMSQASPPWPETVLHNFGCYADGKNPHGGVTFDRHGNLDGTTVSGGSGGSCGSDGCGIVFQLTSSTESVLYNFTGSADGFGPGGGVVFDSAGNVYGMTPDGGAHSEGTIYELSHTGQAMAREGHSRIYRGRGRGRRITRFFAARCRGQSVWRRGGRRRSRRWYGLQTAQHVKEAVEADDALRV